MRYVGHRGLGLVVRRGSGSLELVIDGVRVERWSALEMLQRLGGLGVNTTLSALESL